MIMSTVPESATTIQTDRLLWTDAVQRVSALAHAKLPEALHGRLERATALVLSGAVWMEEDGYTCHVRASNGHGWYAVNGHCRCTDHRTAPDGLCKHRLAHGLYRRASELVRAGLPAPTAALAAPVARRLTPEPSPTSEATTSPREASNAISTPALPEAAFSITLKGTMAGREVLLTARGQTWEEFAANVARLQGLLDGVSHPDTTPATPPAAASEAPTCSTHGVRMAQSKKRAGSWYCPVKDQVTGQYCREKR
jgi:hypothetical protein